MLRTISGLAAALTATLAFVACGSSSNGSTGGGGGNTVNLTAMDFSFSPTQLSVPAGASVTVDLTNSGKTEHSFTLDNGGASVDIDAGKTATANFTAPQSGTLTFHCKYHPTQMTGSISIGGSGGGSSSSSSGGAGY